MLGDSLGKHEWLGRSDASMLAERSAIQDVLVAYCRAIDRRDANLLRRVYWPDATDNHGVYDGPVDGFVAMILPFLAGQRTHHVLGNVLIELADEVARVESYVTAHHFRSTAADHMEHYVVGGRYLDTMQKRNGGWRILRRTFVEDWNQVRPANFRDDALSPEVRRTFGRNGPDDVSYTEQAFS